MVGPVFVLVMVLKAPTAVSGSTHMCHTKNPNMFWKILSAFAGIPREHGFITKAVQEVLKVEIYDYKDHQNLSIPFHIVKGVGL